MKRTVKIFKVISGKFKIDFLTYSEAKNFSLVLANQNKKVILNITEKSKTEKFKIGEFVISSSGFLGIIKEYEEYGFNLCITLSTEILFNFIKQDNDIQIQYELLTTKNVRKEVRYFKTSNLTKWK